MDRLNVLATFGVLAALLVAVVILFVRRDRRRKLRKRPWMTRPEAFGFIAVIVIAIAILSHTR